MTVENEWQTMEATVGRNVRRLRTERGMSQGQLGKLLSEYGFEKMTQTTVAKLELGQRPTRVNEVAGIAHLFGVTVDGLLTDPDASPAAKSELETRYEQVVRDLNFAQYREREVIQALNEARTEYEAQRQRREEASAIVVRLQHELMSLASDISAEQHAREGAERGEHLEEA